MSAVTAALDAPLWAPGTFIRSYPMAANAVIYPGTLVMLLNGYAVAATTATGRLPGGKAMNDAVLDNTGGSNGDLNVPVAEGVIRYANGSSITQADVGGLAYAVDNATVSNVSTGKSICGIISAVDDYGVWVNIGLNAAIDNTELTAFIASLAATTASDGASLVGIEDAGSLYTGSEVEAALQEVVKKANAALCNPVTIPVVLSSIATGAVFARFVPGFNGIIRKAAYYVTRAATTTDKIAQVIPAIGGTAISGGAISFHTTGTSNVATMGAGVSGTAVSGLNSFTATQEITLIAQATAITAFVEGEANVLLFLDPAA